MRSLQIKYLVCNVAYDAGISTHAIASVQWLEQDDMSCVICMMRVKPSESAVFAQNPRTLQEAVQTDETAQLSTNHDHNTTRRL